MVYNSNIGSGKVIKLETLEKDDIMAGCYGNSKEDRYFEKKLHDHLEQEELEVGYVLLEDVRVQYKGHEISAEMIVNSEDDIEVGEVLVAKEPDWIIIEPDEDLKALLVVEALEAAYKYFQV